MPRHLVLPACGVSENGNNVSIMLLSTNYKNKIGENLAYPVGAELISNAVEGIRQFAQTSITFRAKPTTWVSQFNEILRDGTDYVIIECYSEGTRYSGIFDNIFWHIVIYPVLKELKATAREALLAEGLPALKEYLLQTGPPQGQNLYPLAIRFSPSEKRVYC